MRNCATVIYAETIAFNSDDFVTMIFVDVIFLLRVLSERLLPLFDN